jgi:hypothetical protein
LHADTLEREKKAVVKGAKMAQRQVDKLGSGNIHRRAEATKGANVQG